MHAQPNNKLSPLRGTAQSHRLVSYKATISVNIDPATRPEKVRTFAVSISEAVLPAAAEPDADPDEEPVVSRAWMPNVVPVMTVPLTVVVTVAGSGVAVVLEQPDHVPVQEEKGPQPAVHVVQEAVPEQAMPLAFVPQGPPQPPLPLPPGPPGP